MKCVYFCHILVEVFSHMFFEPSYIQTLKRWMHKAHRKQNLRSDVVCKRGTADKKWKWKKDTAINWSIHKHKRKYNTKAKSRISKTATSLKVNILHDHNYSSTQLELYLASFLVISCKFSSLLEGHSKIFLWMLATFVFLSPTLMLGSGL